ncbi:unnamed protein product [Dicrocoelium dendriticum]|nr:unnamed protein product [Dicrocoelium dendriticum]
MECVLRIMLICFPRYTAVAIEQCIHRNCFPGLLMDALFLQERTQEGSVLMYLKRVLLDSGIDTRTWFCTYLKRDMVKDGHMDRLNEYFIKKISAIIPCDPSHPLGDDAVLETLIVLRVLASLRAFANYVFSAELASLLITLLTHRVLPIGRGSHFVTYALAFLIGLRPSLSTSQDTPIHAHSPSNTESRIVSWLHSLLAQRDEPHLPVSTSGGQTDAQSIMSLDRPYIEPLLLLAVLFHTNQPGPITELISTLLGLRIPSLGRTVNAWRKIFLQSVFTEQIIASQAARLPVTRALNRTFSAHLPIQCIIQLLKSHAFSKYHLNIKDWIIGQLSASVRPVHPLLPDLIEAHVTHSFSTSNLTSRNELPFVISEAELLDQFTTKEKFLFAELCTPTTHSFADAELNCLSSPPDPDLTATLLFLYYALFVYDYQFSTHLTANRRSSAVSCIYSDQLWDQIPMSYLLHHARLHLADYAPLYPRLLQLVTNHFPYFTVGEMMIQDELLLDPTWFPEESELMESLHLDGGLNTVQPACTYDSSALSYHYVDEIPCICTPSDLNEAFETLLAHFSSSRGDVHNVHYRVASKKLISLLYQLRRSIRSTNVDNILPHGSVLGRQSVRLLLVANRHPLFTLNRRFASVLEYLWRRLHLVMPRKLHLLAVNTFREARFDYHRSSFVSNIASSTPLTGLDLRIDPIENLMYVVDSRVFRCPSLLCMFLRILESNLIASRSYWSHRLLERSVPPASMSSFRNASTTPQNTSPTGSPLDVNGQSENRLDSPLVNFSNITSTVGTVTNPRPTPISDEDCERYCANMLLTQNATVVQLLLEHCLPTSEEAGYNSEISVLREIRNIICSYIHYMFIAEPALAEVTVWQTFPRSLIPVSAQAIPSLHICLDHVTDVFRLSGDYSKMIFCLDLVSHLSLHYNIQPALERSAFMTDSLYHLLTAVVPADDRPDLLHACLPAFLRVGSTFPNLAPVIIRLILTVGSLIASSLPYEIRTSIQFPCPEESEWTANTYESPLAHRSVLCLKHALWTYTKLIQRSSAQRFLYYSPRSIVH